MKQILIRPVITEKTIAQANKLNKYAFIINRDVNKIELMKEIENKFNVKVTKINVLNVLGKSVTFGKKRIPGKRSDYKKAVVELKKGDKIKIFDIK